MSAPSPTHCFDFSVKLPPRVDLGQTARGHRIVFYIECGCFGGDYASSEMWPGRADSETSCADRLDVPDGHDPELTHKVFIGIGNRPPNEVGTPVHADDQPL